MTLVSRCPGSHQSLMDEPQVQWLPPPHPQLTLPLFRTFPHNPYVSFSSTHLSFMLLFIPPGCSLSLFPLGPSLWVTLWIFASPLRNGTQGTRALQSILQTGQPPRTRSKCHVTTWEDEFEEEEGGQPQNTYCYHQCPDWGTHDVEEREQWWQRWESTGDRNTFQGKEEQQTDTNTNPTWFISPT